MSTSAHWDYRAICLCHKGSNYVSALSVAASGLRKNCILQKQGVVLIPLASISSITERS